MRGKRPDSHRGSGGFACGLQEPLNSSEVAPRHDGNRWTRTGEKCPEDVRIVDREHRAKMRHERGACRLMPAVLKRLAKPIVLAVLQRMDQRQDSLEIEDSVLPRNRRRERGSCL